MEFLDLVNQRYSCRSYQEKSVELYIPAEMGYGKFSQPGIPGGSTLIFEIELLGIA